MRWIGLPEKAGEPDFKLYHYPRFELGRAKVKELETFIENIEVRMGTTTLTMPANNFKRLPVFYPGMTFAVALNDTDLSGSAFWHRENQ